MTTVVWRFRASLTWLALAILCLFLLVEPQHAIPQVPDRDAYNDAWRWSHFTTEDDGLPIKPSQEPFKECIRRPGLAFGQSAEFLRTNNQVLELFFQGCYSDALPLAISRSSRLSFL